MLISTNCVQFISLELRSGTGASAVEPENKVSLESEIQQNDMKQSEEIGKGLIASDIINNEASASTSNVHQISYKMTLTDMETPIPATKISKTSPVECLPLSLPIVEQPSTELPSAIQPVIANTNSSIPCVEIQVQPKEDAEYDITNTPEKKASVEGVKTIKRQTSKGWF